LPARFSDHIKPITKIAHKRFKFLTVSADDWALQAEVQTSIVEQGRKIQQSSACSTSYLNDMLELLGSIQRLMPQAFSILRSSLLFAGESQTGESVHVRPLVLDKKLEA
jgi:hypothetical protein